MMNYKKALVTGGAGFIGSHLAETLNQNNVDQNNSIKISHGKKQHVIVKII